MTRKIRILLGTLFILGLLLIISPNRAHADEIVTQIVSDPAPSTDTATVTALITIQVVDTKINAAQTTLTSASQTQGDAIISIIKSNVPNTDTATAVSIATTQEPIKAAVESATVVIQQANTAIQSAHTALNVAIAAQTSVDTQTAIVTQAVTTLSTKTNDVNSAQTVLTTTQNAQPTLDAAAACTEGSACVHFYNANAELGPLNDQIAVAKENWTTAWWDGVNWVNATFPPDRAAYQAAVVASDAAHADAVAAVPVVAAATDAANTAQDAATQAQAAADASVITTTTNGVKATVYAGTGRTPALPKDNATPILTTTVPQIAFNWGNGSVMGGPADRVIVKFEGTITVPQEAVAVKYAVSSDDGSKMYIDGQLAINNWQDQGTRWSPYSPTYDTTVDKQQDFIIWYYENGGGATCTLGWAIWKADGTGYFTTPGASAFAATVIVKDPVLVSAAVAAQLVSAQAATDLANAQANLDAANTADARAWAERSAAYQKLVEDYGHLNDIEVARGPLAQAISDAQAAYDAKLTERNAAWDSYTSAVHAASENAAAITLAQSIYDQAMQNLTLAQQNLTVEQQNLTLAQQNLTISLQTANSLANVATMTVNEAVTAMTNAAQITVNYYAEQQRIAAENARIAAEQAAAQAAQEKAAAEERAKIAAENAAKAEVARIAAEQAIAEAKAAQEKAAAEAKAAEDARIKTEQDAKEAQAAADKAKADAEIQAAKDAQAKADAAKAEADAKAKAEQDAALAEQKAKDEAAKVAQEAANAKAEADKQKAEADKITADQAAKEQLVKDAKAKEDAAKADQLAKDKAVADAIGVKPNNPDQLSDTVVKEAPKEVLVPHIQVDKKGVENGGIEFFGTKSAPQVVGEDGKLTPPAPPSGSGLPIPAEAITTQDTFIGQPGGTTFNAPDIAVPVLMTYVCETITRDGKEIHLDVNGVEHPISQCTFLPAALNAIPGAGQAVQAMGAAYTAMANIGNDMSPVTRKKAKKILVLTIAVAAIRRRFGS